MKRAEICYQLTAAVWDTDFETSTEVENANTIAEALGGERTNETVQDDILDTPATVWRFPDDSRLIIANDGGSQTRYERNEAAPVGVADPAYA